MKISLFTLLISLSTQCIADYKPYIISGFDDVLRQAENTGLLKASVKILEKDKSFAGMSTLYTLISVDEQAPKFTLVSGIATWFDKRIDKFLNAENFPQHKRYLRNWITELSVEKFKIEKMKQIIAEHPNKNFIVIFDNSGASIILADLIKSEFPRRVLTVYLRNVEKKEHPSHIKLFYTAFDIAINEFNEHRMTEDEVLTVANEILKQPSMELIIPHYALRPTDYSACDSTSEKIKPMCILLYKRLISVPAPVSGRAT